MSDVLPLQRVRDVVRALREETSEVGKLRDLAKKTGDVLRHALLESTEDKLPDIAKAVNVAIYDIFSDGSHFTGLLLLHELVDVEYMESALKATRFANYLRSSLPTESKEAVDTVAATLGKISGEGWVLGPAIIEAELKRCIEWLAVVTSPKDTGLRRYAAIMVIRELVIKAPSMVSSRMEQILTYILNGMRDTRPVAQEACVEAVRHLLKLLNERSTHTRDQWVTRLFDDSWALIDANRTEMLSKPTTNDAFQKHEGSYLAGMLMLGELYSAQPVRRHPKSTLLLAKYSTVVEMVLADLSRLRGAATIAVVSSILKLLKVVIIFHQEAFCHLFLGRAIEAFFAAWKGQPLHATRVLLLDTLGGMLQSIRGHQRPASPTSRAAPSPSTLGRFSRSVSVDTCSSDGHDVPHAAPAVPETWAPQIIALLRAEVASRTGSASAAVLCFADLLEALPNPSYEPEALQIITLALHTLGVTDAVRQAVGRMARVLGGIKDEAHKRMLKTIHKILAPKDPLPIGDKKDDEGVAVAILQALEMLRSVAEVVPDRVLLYNIHGSVLPYLHHASAELQMAALTTAGSLLTLTIVPREAGDVSDEVRCPIAREIMDRILEVAATNAAVAVRVHALQRLPPQLDRYLCTPQSIHMLIASAYDVSEPTVRKAVLGVLGRLSSRQPALVLPHIRKLLVNVLNEMSNAGGDATARGVACGVLNSVILAAPQLSEMYSVAIRTALVPDLHYNAAVLTQSTLGTLDSLVKVAGCRLQGVEELVSIMLEALGGKPSVQRIRACLRCLSSLLRALEWGGVHPYDRYPQLLGVLLGTLQSPRPQSSAEDEIRSEVLECIGVCGAYEPYRLRQTVGQNKNKRIGYDRGDPSSFLAPSEIEGGGEKLSPLLATCGTGELSMHMSHYHANLAIGVMIRVMNDKSLASAHHKMAVGAVVMIVKRLDPTEVARHLDKIYASFLLLVEALHTTDDVSLLSFLIQQIRLLSEVAQRRALQFVERIVTTVSNLCQQRRSIEPEVLFQVLCLIIDFRNTFLEYFKPFVRKVIPVLVLALTQRKVTSVTKALATVEALGSYLDGNLSIIVPLVLRCVNADVLALVKDAGVGAGPAGGSVPSPERRKSEADMGAMEKKGSMRVSGMVAGPAGPAAGARMVSGKKSPEPQSGAPRSSSPSRKTDQHEKEGHNAYKIAQKALHALGRLSSVVSLREFALKILQVFQQLLSYDSTHRPSPAVNKRRQGSSPPNHRYGDRHVPSDMSLSTSVGEGTQLYRLSNSNKSLDGDGDGAPALPYMHLIEIEAVTVLCELLPNVLPEGQALVSALVRAVTEKNLVTPLFTTVVVKRGRVPNASRPYESHQGKLAGSTKFSDFRDLNCNVRAVHGVLEDAGSLTSAGDWKEWLRVLRIELVRESPNPALRSCANLAQVNLSVAKELFNAAYMSCYMSLQPPHKAILPQAIRAAINSTSIPPDVLQPLLILADFTDQIEAIEVDARGNGEAHRNPDPAAVRKHSGSAKGVVVDMDMAESCQIAESEMISCVKSEMISCVKSVADASPDRRAKVFPPSPKSAPKSLPISISMGESGPGLLQQTQQMQQFVPLHKVAANKAKGATEASPRTSPQKSPQAPPTSEPESGPGLLLTTRADVIRPIPPKQVPLQSAAPPAPRPSEPESGPGLLLTTRADVFRSAPPKPAPPPRPESAALKGRSGEAESGPGLLLTTRADVFRSDSGQRPPPTLLPPQGPGGRHRRTPSGGTTGGGTGGTGFLTAPRVGQTPYTGHILRGSGSGANSPLSEEATTSLALARESGLENIARKAEACGMYAKALHDREILFEEHLKREVGGFFGRYVDGYVVPFAMPHQAPGGMESMWDGWLRHVVRIIRIYQHLRNPYSAEGILAFAKSNFDRMAFADGTFMPTVEVSVYEELHHWRSAKEEWLTLLQRIDTEKAQSASQAALLAHGQSLRHLSSLRSAELSSWRVSSMDPSRSTHDSPATLSAGSTPSLTQIASGYRGRKLRYKRRDVMQGLIRALRSLGEWSEVLRLSRGSNIDPDLANEVARAAWMMQDWDMMDRATNLMDSDTVDTQVHRVVLAVQKDHLEEAAELVQSARKLIQPDIAALASESYSRAYPHLVQLQMLSELEEVIDGKQKGGVELMAAEEVDRLLGMWRVRLEAIEQRARYMEAFLSIRSMLVPQSLQLDSWLKFVSVARKANKPALALNTLKMLLKLGERDDATHIAEAVRGIDTADQDAVNPLLACACCVHLWQTGGKEEAFTLLDGYLEKLSASSQQDEHTKVKGKYYRKLGEWYQEQYQDSYWLEPHRSVALDYLRKAKTCAKRCEKAWHKWAMMNHRVMRRSLMRDSRVLPYVIAAAKGFATVIRLAKGGSSIQDLLRLLGLLFAHGHIGEVFREMRHQLMRIPTENWLVVVPQIVARVHHSDPSIRLLLNQLLVNLGKDHTHAIIYPLICVLSSENPIRAKAAKEVLDRISLDHPVPVDEGKVVATSLAKVSLILAEQWGCGIEEARWLLYSERDPASAVRTLHGLHLLMDVKPASEHETIFHSQFSEKLAAARASLLSAEQYLRPRQQAREREGAMRAFHEKLEETMHTYKDIHKDIEARLSKMPYLDLDFINADLGSATDLSVAVPGTYVADQPVVQIQSFSKQFYIIPSKQRPRKITIQGNDGRDYIFLLKGREDLRQDERVMQLFALINQLLHEDRVTAKNATNIEVYSVTPLASSAGLIGWLRNAETLYTIIKEYRRVHRINPSQEKNLIPHMVAPGAAGYDKLTLYQKVDVFEYVLERTKGEDLQKTMWLKSKSSEVWLANRIVYTRSLAVMSMVGFIMGLGDRHPSNLMLDTLTRKVIHVDFGDCFEVASNRSKFPEQVPFRLTRMLIRAMDLAGIEGAFKAVSEDVLRVLRKNKDSLMSILSSFLHDPLINWRLVDPAKLKHEAPPAAETTLPPSDWDCPDATMASIRDDISCVDSYADDEANFDLDHRSHREVVVRSVLSRKKMTQATSQDLVVKQAIGALTRIRRKLDGLAWRMTADRRDDESSDLYNFDYHDPLFVGERKVEAGEQPDVQIDTCGECEIADAVVRCDQCNDAFCEACNEQVHAKRRNRNHTGIYRIRHTLSTAMSHLKTWDPATTSVLTLPQPVIQTLLPYVVRMQKVVRGHLSRVHHPTPPPVQPPTPDICWDSAQKGEGGDACGPEALDIAEQVRRLIREAVAHENLSVAYSGWSPWW
eukprot:TRINITY_DN1637_c0_g1_i1.p1 TRINITY_DN1637_c0_g1~~TRINITY_DN1637_c0_g1_i1.p1  ORF type:complete len:3223 (+),score=943.34 TRINITY_DN1637_c0_g1_i1:82-9750(+)